MARPAATRTERLQRAVRHTFVRADGGWHPLRTPARGTRRTGGLVESRTWCSNALAHGRDRDECHSFRPPANDELAKVRDQRQKTAEQGRTTTLVDHER